MSPMAYLFAGFFLPLFPFSTAFTVLFARLRNATLRGALLLAWPQLGLTLLKATDADIPSWIIAWALITSMLYGFRALALREVGLWTSFLATSAWALLWIPALAGTEDLLVRRYALGFSAPLVLLALLTAGLERRFGAAYTGLYGGLSQTLPRLSGVLVMVVLAAIATPLFPSFFGMLATIVAATPATALTLVAIWLLWSWAGARLLQGLLVGPAGEADVPDLGRAASWAYAAVLVALVIGGLHLAGDLP
jgi:NADH:ubiquinone oxidoreductase subunit 4 (subunit M)